MCQEEIKNLRNCHASNSKFKFWACNELKFALDVCFKKEKKALLDEINMDFDVKRRGEDEAFQEAIGRSVSFEDYLRQDKEYQDALHNAKTRRPGEFAEKST